MITCHDINTKSLWLMQEPMLSKGNMRKTLKSIKKNLHWGEMLFHDPSALSTVHHFEGPFPTFVSARTIPCVKYFHLVHITRYATIWDYRSSDPCSSIINYKIKIWKLAESWSHQGENLGKFNLWCMSNKLHAILCYFCSLIGQCFFQIHFWTSNEFLKSFSLILNKTLSWHSSADEPCSWTLQ